MKHNLRKGLFYLAKKSFLGSGVYIPNRYGSSLTKRINYPEIGQYLQNFEADYSKILDLIDGNREKFLSFSGSGSGPSWKQRYFARTDGAAAYVIALSQPPRQLIEVGSGFSTRFLSQAITDSGAQAKHLALDPAPRSDLLQLPVEWRREMLSESHLELFDSLKRGDIAFFDGSHILLPGSDVDFVFNRILPRISPGVRVHFHDIHLPDPYPEHWENRGYAEQLGLGGWLLGGAFRPIFSSHWAVTRMGAAERRGLRDIPWTGAPEGSLWLERV